MLDQLARSSPPLRPGLVGDERLRGPWARFDNSGHFVETLQLGQRELQRTCIPLSIYPYGRLKPSSGGRQGIDRFFEIDQAAVEFPLEGGAPFRSSHRAEGVRERGRHVLGCCRQLTDEGSHSSYRLFVHVLELREVEVEQRFVPRPDQLGSRIEEGGSDLPFAVQRGDVTVELSSELSYLFCVGLPASGIHGARGFDRLPELGDDLDLASLVRVQLEAVRPETHCLETVLDDPQSRHFLGNEEHPFSSCEAEGDEVGDGLRFSGTRRSFEDEALALAGADDRRELGRVRVDHGEDIVWRVIGVEVFGIR